MRHGDRVKKLGRTKHHRDALLKNLCRALFIFERIRTTLPKAKEARRLAERLLEIAKRNDLSARRHVYRYLPDHKLVKIVCEEIAPRFVNRHGGYTRIIRLGPRLGDGAEMSILELVETADDATIDQRRKLIERRHIVETGKKDKKKEKKEKKVKEKKPKPAPDEKPKTAPAEKPKPSAPKVDKKKKKKAVKAEKKAKKKIKAKKKRK
ncbi:50S ribosomal protein L17 [candidate division WOR-3 bacterium RBG_13_43_14]|uniref:Large ribosomal subunit protein bL17 n=1 Tax=candidate division WOR-3 bacterium RBG_13_43_14 TaxID=1802590 RepID=A0A1F4UC91_UNCW3|nr:MAG: 50S ribosomal protein L17 [candidate division WOR-3 bacterium RBG_13_43_14]